ncbi:acetyltransferase [Pseudarthrobacter sp. AG30]|nr:acetyltransferase [Pseudarthrobacter sp. AG30]
MVNGRNVGEKADHGVRVVDLSLAPGERQAWDRPRPIVYLWALVEILVVTNPLQISSGLRVKALRAFGAEIGDNVIFRPRTRVKFPWKLHIGDRCWIGEGVWFHNQDDIYVDNDVVISQESFLTTGSHAVRRDMALITKPIHIRSGAWLTTRCIVLGGSNIGVSAVVSPGTIVKAGQNVPDGAILSAPDATVVGQRFAVDGQG